MFGDERLLQALLRPQGRDGGCVQQGGRGGTIDATTAARWPPRRRPVAPALRRRPRPPGGAPAAPPTNAPAARAPARPAPASPAGARNWGRPPAPGMMVWAPASNGQASIADTFERLLSSEDLE